MSAILARLREPSSYAGLAMLFGLLGINVAPEAWQAGVQVVSGAAALAAILLRERGR